MQADRFEPGGPPGALGALADRLIRERVAAPATEEKPAATAASQLLLDQVQPQRGGDRDGAAAGATLGATRPAFGSQPQWTRMMFLSRSTMSSASAWSSPVRRPAYIAVAHSARSCLGKAAISRAASPGEAIRSGRPRTAGSWTPVVGFTATSSSARRVGRSLAAAAARCGCCSR